jgi:hypothetical protein
LYIAVEELPIRIINQTDIEAFFGYIDADDQGEVLILVCVFHNLKKVLVEVSFGSKP